MSHGCRACVVCDGRHIMIIFLSAAYLQNVKVQCELWPSKIKSRYGVAVQMRLDSIYHVIIVEAYMQKFNTITSNTKVQGGQTHVNDFDSPLQLGYDPQIQRD